MVDKKPKIAVCLFGHLRTYKYCYKFLKENLLDLYDCDVFMHTWSTLSRTQKGGRNELISDNSTLKLKDEIIKLYNLKDILIEEQKNNESEYGIVMSEINTPLSLFGMHNMFYSNFKANQLREEYQKKYNVQYDYVICTRPDVILYEKFDIEQQKSGLSQNQLDKAFFCTAGWHPQRRMNDAKCAASCNIFYWAKPEIISNACNNFNHILEKFIPDMKLERSSESYLLDMIEDLGYQWYFVNYKLGLIREIPKQLTKLEKHKNNLKQALKQVAKIPEECLATAYYYIIGNTRH